MDDRPYPLVKTWNDAKQRYEWVETEPDACPACGAAWDLPRTMLRGYEPCGTHRGHRTWRCQTCRVATLNPPGDDTCR